MNTKEMLKNEFKKKTVALVISRDPYYTNKKHFIVVDSIEHAKEFKTGETIQQVTMYYKENSDELL